MVDIADRRRRPDEGNDAVPHERPQDQHVVSLVGIERPTRRQVRQAEERRHDQQAGQGPTIVDPGAPHRHERADRDRALPARSNASAGNGLRASPDASARARSMLTLS
jgi:hypothetical protein